MAGLGWRRPNGSFSTVTTLLATRTTSSTYKPRCVFAVSGSVSWNSSPYLHLPSSTNPPSTETSCNSFRPSLHNPSLLMPANFRRQRKTISVPRGVRPALSSQCKLRAINSRTDGRTRTARQQWDLADVELCGDVAVTAIRAAA